MRKTLEYRLQSNRHQRELLMTCLIGSRHLYNEMLRTVRDYYAESGKFLFKYELTNRFKGLSGEHVRATTVQTLAGLRVLVLESLSSQLALPRSNAAGAG